MRSKIWSLCLLAAALLLALAVPAQAQAQAAGVLEGQVVNGTAGGPQVGAGLTVTLHILDGETEAEPRQTATDAEGRFRFEGLEAGDEVTYWPEVTYLDVPYAVSEGLAFAADETTLSAALTVYETTEDDSGVSLNAVHFIAESLGQVLRISEVHLFRNRGDRTYVGKLGETGATEGVRTTVFVPLPEGMVGEAFDDPDPDRFIVVTGGVRDTAAVPPGNETSIVQFSYHLAVTGDTVALERSFAYPVDQVNVLVVQPGLTLRSEQLQAAEPMSFQGQDYEIYQALSLSPQVPLSLEFVPTEGDSGQGMPSAGASSASGAASTQPAGNQPLLRWFALFFAVLAVVGAVAYPRVVKRAVAAPPVSRRGAPKSPEARHLLADLADLEQAFESGDLDEGAYEQQRAALVEAVKSAWQ